MPDGANIELQIGKNQIRINTIDATLAGLQGRKKVDGVEPFESITDSGRKLRMAARVEYSTEYAKQLAGQQNVDVLWEYKRTEQAIRDKMQALGDTELVQACAESCDVSKFASETSLSDTSVSHLAARLGVLGYLKNGDPKIIPQKLHAVQADGSSFLSKDDVQRTLKARKQKTDQEVGVKAQKESVNGDVEKIDRRIRLSAETLKSLDQFAGNLSVDENTGKITVKDSNPVQIADDEKRRQFEDLKKRFREDQDRYVGIFAKDKNILDTKQVEGAVVVVFDSRKGIPERLGGENDRGFHYSASEYYTTGVGGVVETKQYFSVIGVDINPDKRTDGVSPTVSLQHEFRHHALSAVDYLMTQDNVIPLQSGYRKGRKPVLFGNGPDRLNTDLAFRNDGEVYGPLMGREFDNKTDVRRVDQQLAYLDELHSSYLQMKDNWFNAKADVYAYSGSKAKHWELVGDHPDDIDATKRLLGYTQGMYLCMRMRNEFLEWKTNGQPIGIGQEQFMNTFQDVFADAGGLIGTARTVQQAERLVGERWKKFAESELGKKVLGSSRFKQWLETNTQPDKGWAVENLTEILGLQQS